MEKIKNFFTPAKFILWVRQKIFEKYNQQFQDIEWKKMQLGKKYFHIPAGIRTCTVKIFLRNPLQFFLKGVKEIQV